MEYSKLTLRVQTDFIQQAKEFSKAQGVSLSKLFEKLLAQEIEDKTKPKTPFVPQELLDKAFYARPAGTFTNDQKDMNAEYHEYIINRGNPKPGEV